jgi:hypothetical protein
MSRATAQFYGFTERGVEVLHENTRKTEKVERHESAPRPELPDAVADALEFDEPDLDAVDVDTDR